MTNWNGPAQHGQAPAIAGTTFVCEYPVHERPSVVAGLLEGRVRDCSERGIRARLNEGQPAGAAIAVGDRVSATILFRSGESATVDGEVTRFDGQTFTLRLDPPGIPFSEIVREQQWAPLARPLGERPAVS